MLYIILRHIRNFFPGKARDGYFEIENGKVDLSLFVKEGQYILIEDSDLNNGVYKYDQDLILKDEKFVGRITALKIPDDFLKLTEEIEEYINSGKDNSPYTSESFGGYSYSRAQSASGGVATWKDVFRSRLDAWRKL